MGSRVIEIAKLEIILVATRALIGLVYEWKCILNFGGVKLNCRKIEVHKIELVMLKAKFN